MGFGDWVRLMNWGCVPGSLNGWVGVSPLGLDGLGSEIDSCGFFVTHVLCLCVTRVNCRVVWGLDHKAGAGRVVGY